MTASARPAPPRAAPPAAESARPGIETTRLPGVLLVKPRVHPDARGCFLELYRAETYAALGIGTRFVQDNFSHSTRNVLRGLHYQVRRTQTKLVSVTRGTVFDVAVDIRRGSPCFGQWVGVELSDANRHQLLIPAGFAHGFCVLSATADLFYKCSDVYDPPSERGVHYASALFSIDWPVRMPVVSARDAALPDAARVAATDWPA